jgi:hypothetical protein
MEILNDSKEATQLKMGDQWVECPYSPGDR